MNGSRFVFFASQACLVLGFTVGLSACRDADDDASTGEPDTSVAEATYTWHRDVQPIVAGACSGCHVAGDIAPFELTTYEQVSALSSILGPAIESEAMPPWPPAPGCNEYKHDRSLSVEERETLLTWIDEGSPEGDPADAVEAPDPGQAWVADVSVEMPEPYLPVTEPDDYRCFLIDGPELADTDYVTGLEVYPGERSVVHHVIAFVIDPENVETFEAYDDADPEPGYTCFGGPTGAGGGPLASAGARWLGAWVPGTTPWVAPEGTGIALHPGSKLVVQMHYNTSSSAPVADRTTVGLALSDEVERPAMMLPVTNFEWVTGAVPMTIPAGDPAVVHSMVAPRSAGLLTQMLGEIGATPDDTLYVNTGALHMHLLGHKARISIGHADQSESCLVQIDDYDFGWQGSYRLQEAVPFGPDDEIRLSCEWDNSMENQPIVDGQIGEPKDTAWGEGTYDEMCLGVLYVSK